ncbi:MAG TPA: AraC family transcriptional regulator [Pyrinomonadaceae bacterium]
MQIEWKSNAADPYISRQIAEWPGALRVHRAQVYAGKMNEHVNDFHEVNVALSGSLTTWKGSATGRQVFTSNRGNNLCITPAGQAISAEWNGKLDNLMILLNANFVSRTAIENGFSPNIEFVEVYRSQDPLIQNIGLTLLETSVKGNPLGSMFADSLIQTLTLHLLSNYTYASEVPVVATGGLPGYRLNRVIEFIDTNLENDISLADLAAVAELSTFHFSRAFRKSTGKTPQQFVMHQRLERAKILLARPDLPIVEVSLRSGFKNQSHFTAWFRKYTKFTPKLWRDLKLA